MIRDTAYSAAESQRDRQRELAARAAHLAYLADCGASPSFLDGKRSHFASVDRERFARLAQAREAIAA